MLAVAFPAMRASRLLHVAIVLIVAVCAVLVVVHGLFDHAHADAATEVPVRRGERPSPRQDLVSIATGEETTCDGCGEAIRRTEEFFDVRVRGLVGLRFHHECYSAWIAYTGSA